MQKYIFIFIFFILIGCQSSPTQNVNSESDAGVNPNHKVDIQEKFSQLKSTDISEWPEADFKNCDYYQKVEKILKCAPQGHDYLINYGYFYCKEFKKESQRWSKEAQLWTQNTGQCLQEMIKDNKEKRIVPCGQMEEFAFDVHPVCYKQYKICDLRVGDIYNITTTVRRIDLLTRRSLSQMINVGLACFEKYFSVEESATFNRIAIVTRKYNLHDREKAVNVFQLAPRESFSARRSYFKYALSLLLGTKKSPAPNQAVKIYSDKFGKPAVEGRSDVSFFDCSESVALNGKEAHCRDDYVREFKGLSQVEAQGISSEVSAEDFARVVETLKRWSQYK